jgi:peptidoglycan hydrolase CwlO-like protein
VAAVTLVAGTIVAGEALIRGIQILQQSGEEGAGEGAKSQEEYDKHQAGVEAAEKELQQLQDKLKTTKGPKAQRPIKEAIDRLKQDIKGHGKEMGQKWPHGRP